MNELQVLSLSPFVPSGIEVTLRRLRPSPRKVAAAVESVLQLRCQVSPSHSEEEQVC